MPGVPWMSVVAAGIVLAGCSVPLTPPTTRPSSGAPSPSPSATSVTPHSTPSVLTARQRCALALPKQELLGWGDTTVGVLRSFRYGPYGNPPVLAKAFRGVPDAAAGTWCVTRPDSAASAWWGVVDATVMHVVTIEGPGEGRHLGLVRFPPAIP